MTGIEAAKAERDGLGVLAVDGKAVVYRDGHGKSYRFPMGSKKDAEQLLRIMRSNAGRG